MTQHGKTRLRAGLTLAAAGSASSALLLLVRPDQIRVAGDDPAAGVVVACAWAGWVLTGYLLLGICAAAVAQLPRSPGRVRRAQHLVALVTPRALRRLVEVAVGASTAAVVLAAPAAAYADTPPTPRPAAAAQATTPLDWPGLEHRAPHPAARAAPIATSTPSPPPTRPRTPPATPPREAAQPKPHRPAAVGLVAAAPARAAAAPAEEVVVHAGDSLWTLTARHLGPSATPAAIAAEWPRLFAANRAVIGTNPDLIHPGQRLRAPAADRRNAP